YPILQQEAENHRQKRSNGERQPEISGKLIENKAEIGPDHVEGAMGEVEDIHQPENDGQPDRHQEEQHGKLKAIQQIKQKKRHGSLSVSFPGILAFSWNKASLRRDGSSGRGEAETLATY